MMRRKRAMPSHVASHKKRMGHINEQYFADIIGGEVVGNSEKTDVIDTQGKHYSVKSAQWCQVFLYARDRFVDNTEFQDIGNVANIIIDCIDAFPLNQENYVANKDYFKRRLQIPMRQLKDEICKPTILPRLLSKGLFNGDEVDYLAILPNELSDENTPVSQKHFHIFSAVDVVKLLSNNLDVQNSKARKKGDTDDLKVVFRYENRNIGEIEIRTVPKVHYKRAWGRLDSSRILQLFTSKLVRTVMENTQVSVYGSARDNF